VGLWSCDTHCKAFFSLPSPVEWERNCKNTFSSPASSLNSFPQKKRVNNDDDDDGEEEENLSDGERK
jgi:hypothetical protein